MIAKKIAKNPAVSDSFKALAEYIAGAPEKGEKLEDLWISNCDAGSGQEDLGPAIAEVEATRGISAPAENKSYHLMVSFRPGERPPADALRDIERNFAEALGFGEHQRVAGTHADTDHFHLHVAINRVHPQTLRVHSPWKDYKVLEEMCRAMEKKHGLQVDRGRSDYVDYGKFRDVVSPAARDFEASTWRQSFQNQVLDGRERIVKAAGKARDWQALHKGLAKLDLEIVQRGRGLVLRQPGGREAVKASLVDRLLSSKRLQERLGPYEAMKAPAKAKPGRRYEGRPLGRHPGTSRLWRAFLGQRRRPKTLLGRIAADWKQFLMNEAYRDPLALAVIIAYKEMFRAVFGSSARVPKPVRPALRHWMEKGEWAAGAAGPWLKPGQARGMAVKTEGGNLLVPFRDKDGHIWGLQALRPDGKAMEIGDVRKSGLLHIVDPEKRLAARGKDAPVVVLTDSLVKGFAIRQATRAPVALVPPDGGMKAAVKSLRVRNRDCRVVAVGSREFVERAEKAGIEAKALEIRRKAVKPAALRVKLAPLMGDRAQVAWSELKGAPWATPGNAPWLMKNGVRGFGVKLAENGDVVMPLKDVRGRLRDVKFIGKDGVSRRAGADGDSPPLMHLIDPERRAGGDAIVIAGDYLSGAAIHNATRLPVAVADEPENIGEAARALRERCRDTRLVIAADRERAGSLKELCRETGAAMVSPPQGAASFAEKAGEPDAVRDVLADAAEDTVWLRWRAAEPLGEEAGVPPGLPRDGLRRDKDGKVLVPLTDAGGRVWGLCAVDGWGQVEERTAAGETAGLMHAVGKDKHAGRGDAVIAEDLASAAAVHEATGRPALCAFGSENLTDVARAWRQKHPKAEIAVAATDSSAAERNVSADNAAAAAKAVGGKLIRPPLTENDKAEGRTCFGDLWRDKSRRREVRRRLAEAIAREAAHGVEF